MKRNSQPTEEQAVQHRLRTSNLAVKRSLVPDLVRMATDKGKPNPGRSVRRFLQLSARQFRKASRGNHS